MRREGDNERRQQVTGLEAALVSWKGVFKNEYTGEKQSARRRTDITTQGHGKEEKPTGMLNVHSEGMEKSEGNASRSGTK